MNQALGVVATDAQHTPIATSGIVVSLTIDAITIRLPDLDEPIAGLAPDEMVRLRLTSSQGLHEAEVKVLRLAAAPYLAITVRPPRRFETTQLREFFRIAVKMPVVCTLTKTAAEDALSRVDASATTEDLSAGGMRLHTSLTLQLGDEVELLLKVRNVRGIETALTLKAQVLRAIRIREGAGTTAGVKFIYANQRQQDGMVLVMFELQRRSLL